MRPGQQNRRSRNRGNRKGPNPLSRNYESNGPDVKIRGNAQHIADKYAQLARDATASGDRVMAENYLQHAEHYNRIIAAAQAAAGIQQIRERDDDSDSDSDDDDNNSSADNNARGNDNNGSGPQPVIDGVPAEVALDEKPAQSSDDSGENRRPRRQRRPRQDNNDEAPAEASASDGDGEKPAKPRTPRQRRKRDNDGDEAAAQSAEDGSAIGWLAAAGQD